MSLITLKCRPPGGTVNREMRGMPRICEFYGIVIYMYFQDHNPPHFHAIYGEHEAIVSIESSLVLEGKLPRRAFRLVWAWSHDHREELLADWDLARQGRPLRPIAPLN